MAAAVLIVAGAAQQQQCRGRAYTVLLYICVPLVYGSGFFARWGDCGAVLGRTPGAGSESGPAWVRSWPRSARNG